MDENRKAYQTARAQWLKICADILKRVSKYDPELATIQPKDCIFRINNNRMFHPDKPIYKDNFGFSPGSKDRPAFYLHISPHETFVGGGLWKPENAVLKKIREDIDYDAKVLHDILKDPKFESFYGGLDDDPDQLKSSPQGYSNEHPEIDLLRRKNFTAIRTITREQAEGSDFLDIIEEAFITIHPLNAWLQKAMDFEA